MISIIIPSYNQQEYLPNAIESCLDQILIPNEIIVIDDGSTDNSLEIAKKYPVKVISQTNRGLASARNTGIMNATQDWILPLDADDMLIDKTIVETTEATYQNPDADVIGLSFKTFGTSSQEIILMQDPKLEDFRKGNRLGYCCAIKKSKLLEVGGYSPKMIEGWEDLHLWINLLTQGAKIKTIPTVLWLYRTKKESMWTNSEKYHDKLLSQINADFPQAQLNF